MTIKKDSTSVDDGTNHCFESKYGYTFRGSNSAIFSFTIAEAELGLQLPDLHCH